MIELSEEMNESGIEFIEWYEWHHIRVIYQNIFYVKYLELQRKLCGLESLMEDFDETY